MASKPQFLGKIVKRIPEKANKIASTGGIDTTFHLAVSYLDSSGDLQIPLATSDGTECRIVKTSQRIQKKVVDWVAERIGGIPEIPDPNTGDTNEVLEESITTPVSVNYLPDGVSKIFSISGKYIYIIKKPTNKVQFPLNSFDKETRKEEVKNSSYKKLI